MELQLAVLAMLRKLLEYIFIENWKRDVGQLKLSLSLISKKW